jgi:hypothetical protein
VCRKYTPPPALELSLQNRDSASTSRLALHTDLADCAQKLSMLPHGYCIEKFF